MKWNISFIDFIVLDAFSAGCFVPRLFCLGSCTSYTSGIAGLKQIQGRSLDAQPRFPSVKRYPDHIRRGLVHAAMDHWS